MPPSLLSAFLQSLATKLVEVVFGRIVERIAPRVLRTVPHQAPPNCPRCGGYGVARWAPAGVRAVFLLSLFAFALGFTFAFLGVPVAVLTVAVSVAQDGFVGLLRGLVGVLGLLVPASVMMAGAVGLAWYHSYPPKWCARCQARWPRQDRAAYLRAAGALLFRCGCGQRLRVPATARGTRIRCPRCRVEGDLPAPDSRGRSGRPG
ncbi:hypothetical protein [Micromonospora sp. NPDC051006]|uniref:hypothetical protein n=1 Tax=Micromonospora sp. NPDC051006 TaxID=3364283 RepID=UPI00379B250B